MRSRSVGGYAEPSRLPSTGQAEQTAARPASVRTCVEAVMTWRAGRRPAPGRAGRRQTGLRVVMLIIDQQIFAGPPRPLCGPLEPVLLMVQVSVDEALF